MADLKVAVFSAQRYVRDFLEEPLLSKFPNSKFFEAQLDQDTAVLAKGFDAVNLFVNDICDVETVKGLKDAGVKLITMRCAGFDRVDLAACAEAGIQVTRVPAYSPDSVAQHALALMFALARNLHLTYARVQQGNYALSGLIGFEVFNKTFGIVGTGKIGQILANYLLGVGAKVLAYDVYQNKELLEKGVQYVDITTLLKESDIVSLHCPLLPSTFHIMNRERLELMKPGAMLINVGRGGLVDTAALVESLRHGTLGSYGADVYEEEGSLFFTDFTQFAAAERIRHWDDKFMDLKTLPNVIITPHSAFLTREALSNIAGVTLENLQEFAAGKPLTNEVKAS